MSQAKIVLLLSYICVASISAAIITPALLQIQRDFQLEQGQIEWAVSSFLFGYVFGQLIYGPLANRFGRLHALRTGLLVNLLGIILCLLAVGCESFGFLLFGRLITALGAAAGLCCTLTLINELLTEEQAKQTLSFAVVAFTLGAGASVTLGGLITQYAHWYGCFWVLMAHGIIMFLATWNFSETLKNPQPINICPLLRSYFNIISKRQFFAFSAVVGLAAVVNYGYSASAPIFTQSVLGLSPFEYGYWNIINMSGMLSSGFLSAYLLKRYCAKFVVKIGLSCLIPCIISICLISISNDVSCFWFFTSTTLAYLFSSMLFSPASFVATQSVEDKANASSVLSFVNMGSATLAVMLIGFIPYSSILSFALVLSLFFLVTACLSRPYLR